MGKSWFARGVYGSCNVETASCLDRYVRFKTCTAVLVPPPCYLYAALQILGWKCPKIWTHTNPKKEQEKVGGDVFTPKTKAATQVYCQTWALTQVGAAAWVLRGCMGPNSAQYTSTIIPLHLACSYHHALTHHPPFNATIGVPLEFCCPKAILMPANHFTWFGFPNPCIAYHMEGFTWWAFSFIYTLLHFMYNKLDNTQS